MSIRLFNNSGGYIDLNAAGDGTAANTFTLPAVTTTLVGTDATQTLTNKTLGSGLVAGASLITSGTSVASTSGTSIDFTGIPSWVKRITIMFDGVSTSGTARLLIQLGDSGGVETSSYSAASYYLQSSASNGPLTNTSGFVIYWDEAAAFRSGEMVISLIGASTNTWVSTHTISILSSSNGAVVGGGTKSLSATLDRVRITTTNGTDTFDAGSINILYE